MYVHTHDDFTVCILSSSHQFVRIEYQGRRGVQGLLRYFQYPAERSCVSAFAPSLRTSTKSILFSETFAETEEGLWCTSRCHQNIIIVLPLFKSLHFCDSIKPRQMTVSRLSERQLIEISNLLVFVFLDISQYCNLNIYNESIKVTFEDRSNLKANLWKCFLIYKNWIFYWILYYYKYSIFLLQILFNWIHLTFPIFWNRFMIISIKI